MIGYCFPNREIGKVTPLLAPSPIMTQVQSISATLHASRPLPARGQASARRDRGLQAAVVLGRSAERCTDDPSVGRLAERADKLRRQPLPVRRARNAGSHLTPPLGAVASPLTPALPRPGWRLRHLLHPRLGRHHRCRLFNRRGSCLSDDRRSRHAAGRPEFRSLDQLGRSHARRAAADGIRRRGPLLSGTGRHSIQCRPTPGSPCPAPGTRRRGLGLPGSARVAGSVDRSISVRHPRGSRGARPRPPVQIHQHGAHP